MRRARPRIERTRLKTADLRRAWREHAEEFVAWVRKPMNDSYDRYHRDQFLEIVPPPGRLTIDIGCGEGRLSRELAARGHRMIGMDVTPTMIARAREASPGASLAIADAAALPVRDGAVDVAVAFMSMQDVDDFETAIAEAARVLEPSGRLAMAVVHPLNSAGAFGDDEANAPFVIEGSYLEHSFYSDRLERDGLGITFVSVHRPLEIYVNVLAAAGFTIDRISETLVPDAAVTEEHHRRWQRIPLFLNVLATLTSQS